PINHHHPPVAEEFLHCGPFSPRRQNTSRGAGLPTSPVNPLSSSPSGNSARLEFAMLQGPWRIEMFGRLRALNADRVVDRFRTEKTGSLLAYLAYFGDRSHSREELIEMF